MNLIDINESQIKALSKVSMNLSHYWLLHLLQEADVVVYIPQIRERKLLEDRGLISKTGITAAGKVLYDQIKSIELEAPVAKKKEEDRSDNGFEIWWIAFPASANFQYKGMQFTSSRGLRNNKPVCKLLYNKVIAQGVKPEEMLNAINHQVKLMKEESWETGKNKLEYFQGSEVYLRQQRYEPFLSIGEGHEDEQPSDNCYA